MVGVREDAIASKPAPTLVLRCAEVLRQTQNLWERACSRWRWVRLEGVECTDASRAGSLPHWIFGAPEFCG